MVLSLSLAVHFFQFTFPTFSGQDPPPLDLAQKDARLSNPLLPENAQLDAPRIEPQPGSKGLYWGARNIYVTNVQQSIDASLSAVLRLYHARVRHLSFAGGTTIWNFVTGTVSRPEES